MGSDIPLPKLREDIEVFRHDNSNDTQFILRDPVQQKSFSIDRRVAEILSVWGESSSSRDLLERVRRSDPGCGEQDISDVINYVVNFDLVDVRSHSFDQIAKNFEIQSKVRWKPPVIKIHVLDPQPIIIWLENYFPSLGHRHIFWFTAALFLLASVIAIPEFSALENLWNPSFRNLITAAIAIFICKSFHELAHAVVAARYGAVVTSIGVMWYGFIPIPYTDLADIWSVRGKSRKIFVALSGMIAELYVAAYAFVLWVMLPAGFVSDICAYAFTLNLVQTIVFNANPLGRADGYYVLNDYLGARNLKVESAYEVLNILFSFVGHFQSEPKAELRAFWFAAYSIACILYRILLIVSFAWLLNMVGHWGGISIFGYFAVIFFIAILPTFVEYRVAWLEFRRKSVGMRARLSFLILCGGIISALALLPVPSYISAPAVLGSSFEAIIYTNLSGELTSHIPSEPVSLKEGDILASQTDQDMDTLLKDAQLYAQAIRLSRNVQAGVRNFSRSLELSELSSKADARVESALIRRQQFNLVSPGRGQFIPHFETLGHRRLPASMPIGQFKGDEARITIFVKPSDLSRIAVGNRFQFVDAGAYSLASGTILNISYHPVSRVIFPELYNTWGGPLPVASSETGELAPLAQFFELHGKLEQNSSTSPNLRVSGKVIIHGEGSSIFGIIIDFAATFLRRIFVLI